MAGGVGSRFWPYSSKQLPKQFLDVTNTGETLIQQTVSRFKDLVDAERVYVVTNRQYLSLVQTQLPGVKKEHILLEPKGRNTAPCIAYASYKIYKQNPEANLIVTPADHIILKTSLFKNYIREVLQEIQGDDKLITLGIQPTRPDTGYGYIKLNVNNTKGRLYKVERFTEKPDLHHAKVYFKSEDYLWNSGIFIWSAKSIIHAFERYKPNIHKLFSSVEYASEQEPQQIQEVYDSCEEISIDYAILEQAQNVYVRNCAFGWSDLGTWLSLYDVSNKDDNQNVIEGDVRAYDTKNSIIKISNDKLLIVEGLDNHIVVEKDNKIIICRKNSEQNLKQFVQNLKDEGYNI